MLSVVSGSIVSGERCEVSGLRTVGLMDDRKLCDGFVFVRMLIGEDIVLKIPLIWSGVIVCDGRNLDGLRKGAVGVVGGKIGNGVGDGE